MRCTYGEMDWFCHREAGHAGPHESEPLRPDVSADSPLRASGLSDEPKATGPGIGMPAALYLDQFGAVVRDAFGHYPYRAATRPTHSAAAPDPVPQEPADGE